MNDAEGAAAGELTIDELAAQTGVPSRTIRFYQAKGVLPAPKKRGRVAVYDESHAERLRIVAELQDKGLRLRAIRELVSRSDLDSDAIQKWLGVGQQLGTLSADVPQLLSEDELRQLMGNPPPGAISHLVRRGAIEPQGEGISRRYLVQSPALLRIAMRLSQLGIDLDTAVGMHDILQRRMQRAADEIVEFVLQRVGRGFGRSGQPEEIQEAIAALFGDDGIGSDAVQVIFTREIERAVQQALRRSGTSELPPRPRRRR